MVENVGKGLFNLRWYRYMQIRSEYGRKRRKGKKYIAGLLGVKRGLQGLKRGKMVGRETETQRVGHRRNL